MQGGHGIKATPPKAIRPGIIDPLEEARQVGVDAIPELLNGAPQSWSIPGPWFAPLAKDFTPPAPHPRTYIIHQDAPQQNPPE